MPLMPSADPAASVTRYLELLAAGASADEIAGLYAQDATIEDPVGSDLRRGRDAIREFYAAIENVGKQTELLSVKAVGDQAAFLWSLTVKMGESSTRVEPISVMTFDEDGKITSMRAFWSSADITML